MSDEKVCQPEEPKPRVCIQATEDEVKDLSLGETTTISITGKIISLSKDSWSKGDKPYRIELEDYTMNDSAPVEKEKITAQDAEKMPLKKLERAFSKSEEK